MQYRSDRGGGEGGTAPRIMFELLLVFVEMDRLTNDVRQEHLWTMMFAGDSGICSEHKGTGSRWRNI